MKVEKMKDKGDKFTIEKKEVPSIPFRSLIVGRTGASKTTLINSLLTNKDAYLNDFRGKDIYIFSPLKNDFKMEQIIKTKSVPDENVYTELDDEILNTLYDVLVENFETLMSMKKKVRPTLIVIDDFSFSGALRSGFYNSLARIFCNSRKSLISIIITSQYYHHILPVCKTNASSIYFYTSSLKQRENLAEDYNYLKNKKQFFRMLDDNLKENRDFILIDLSKPRSEIYRNKNFEVIDTDEYL